MVRPDDDPMFEASLCLPTDALNLLSSGDLLPSPRSSPSSSSWALLESLAYMVRPGPGGVRNRTTAQTLMPDGRTIEVTFLLADSPRRSYWCISVGPDAAAHSHSDQDQDQGQDDDDDNPFDSIPKIVFSAEDLALIQVGLTTCKHWLWLVYTARARGPSLVLLPDIHDHQPLMEPYGISTDSNDGFVLAALSYNYEVDAQYDLHLFSYTDSTWTCNRRRLAVDYGWTRKPHHLYPDKVIALGDGLLGWVDLWEGILVCDVRAADKHPATARFVPMPTPLPGNQDLYGKDFSSARRLRDVSFGHGQIRCVEIEQLMRPKPRATPVVHDPSELLLLFDSQSPMVPEKDEYESVGWRLVIWFRVLTWGHWQRGTILYSDQVGNFSWKDLQTCTPVLCDDDDNAVYLTSMLKNRRPQDKTAWMVTVDAKTKSLPHHPVPFSTDRSSPDYPNLIPCALTRYLMP